MTRETKTWINKYPQNLRRERDRVPAPLSTDEISVRREEGDRAVSLGRAVAAAS
jgi:hypothetical protein